MHKRIAWRWLSAEPSVQGWRPGTGTALNKLVLTDDDKAQPRICYIARGWVVPSSGSASVVLIDIPHPAQCALPIAPQLHYLRTCVTGAEASLVWFFSRQYSKYEIASDHWQLRPFFLEKAFFQRWSEVSLGTFEVPIGARGEPQFLGVLFDSPVVTDVDLTVGANALFNFNGASFQSFGGENLVSGTDLVVTDNFVFAEPTMWLLFWSHHLTS